MQKAGDQVQLHPWTCNSPSAPALSPQYPGYLGTPKLYYAEIPLGGVLAGGICILFPSTHNQLFSQDKGPFVANL